MHSWYAALLVVQAAGLAAIAGLETSLEQFTKIVDAKDKQEVSQGRL